MRSRLAFAPGWVLSLVMGTLMALGSALTYWALGGPVLIPALLQGVLFGLVMGPFARRENERGRAATGLDDREEILAAGRAAGRGPVPADPRVREAAHRLALQRLDLNTRMRRFTVPVFGLAALAYAAAAIWFSPWYVLAVVFFAGMALLSPLEVRRLERRVDRLENP